MVNISSLYTYMYIIQISISLYIYIFVLIHMHTYLNTLAKYFRGIEIIPKQTCKHCSHPFLVAGIKKQLLRSQIYNFQKNISRFGIFSITYFLCLLFSQIPYCGVGGQGGADALSRCQQELYYTIIYPSKTRPKASARVGVRIGGCGWAGRRMIAWSP